MIKAIIFDCFGVFTEDGWLAFCQKFSTKATIDELRYINHQVDRGRMAYEDFLEAVCTLTGARRHEAHKIITTTHHPNEALFTYATTLKELGYKLGMISNVGDDLTNYLPQTYVDLFVVITLSYQVGVIKPNAAIYYEHIDQLGVEADECVFFDDRESNVIGAQTVGMHAYVYTTIEQVRKDLKNCGVT